MQIVAALFIDEIELRQVPGPATRIDLTGIQFSGAAPGPFPVTVEPHLVVIVRCGPDEADTGALEVVFRRPGDPADAEPVARNVQPLQVDPGKFAYRLVRGELPFDEAGTIEAHCRIDLGEVTVVPYTLLAPVD
jgi:hypothetical protein